MNTFKKTLVALAIAIPLLSGCTVGSPSTEGDNDAKDIITVLDGADKIHAKKNLIHINDHWTITADGEVVGIVIGEPLHLVGDTYSFYTPNGHFVGAMEENWNVVNRNSDILNQDKEPVGYLVQDIVRIMQELSLYDSDDTEIEKVQDIVRVMQELRLYDNDDAEIGKIQQKLNLGLNADIKDSEGDVEWKVKRDLVSLGASVTLDKENQDDISSVNALFMALMLNEIYEAEGSK